MSAASSPAVLAPSATSIASNIVEHGSSFFKLDFFSAWLSKNAVGTILALVSTLLVLEQVRYRSKKGNLPGATWTIPVIGKFLDSLHPTLENYQKGWNAGPMSVASVFHIFIVLASNNEFARKVLHSPTYAEPCLVASAKQVLLKENWVFLHGKVHADYRRALNVLFTRRALSVYLPVQERIYKKYFKSWLEEKDAEHSQYMMRFRDLNMETSLRVFCGDYITDAGAQEISDKYWLITLALELVNFPFALPGTKVYNAIQARKVTMKYLEKAAQESKNNMEAGAEVTCLMDAWTKAMIDARAGAGDDVEERKALTREFSNHEIAMVVLSFLFASQDAMTSTMTNTFQLLADHPDILAKVREEQYRVRNNDVDAPITLEMIDQMTYTRAMVKESLRVLPPVIMVPYMTTKPFPISPDYTVPKGTMLIPSFWNSLHDETVYPEPDAFKPERWLEKDGLAEGSPKNYLVWGAGAHKCIGTDYATMHVIASVGSASVTMDWDHKITPESHRQKVIATIFPKDNCWLKFTPRPKPSEI